MNSLLAEYPALRDALPCIDLAELPTPLVPLPSRCDGAGAASVHVKCDDLTSAVYGGNKVRKLSLLLGAARARGARSVLTFGGAGSNHALATALFAARLGMRCRSILGPQHNAHSVRRNLLAALRAGAILCPCAWHDTAGETRRRFFEAADEDGVCPSVIPPGGSSPLGAVGFVDAAFELRAQVRAGALQEPHSIYVASGTMGTCVGLALGLAAAGMSTRVEAVRVTTDPYTGMARARALFRACNSLLSNADPEFPQYPFPEDRFRIREDFFGGQYALYTDASADAVRRARQDGGIHLEGTYTGKTFAALLHDAAAGALRGKRVVFWNTHNSRDMAALGAGADWHDLPQALHRYFEEPVQPLDRE
jgi:D-cysteine desulfhydrase